MAICSFLATLIVPVGGVLADEVSIGMPQPGTMVNLSPAYRPVLIKGLKIHPENPFLFDFIIDTGDEFSHRDENNHDKELKANPPNSSNISWPP